MSLSALLLSLTIVAGAAPGAEEALEHRFRLGIEAYDAQDYDGAIEHWEQLRRFRVESAALEYNLGNGYFKRQEYGRAVLHWERALLLDGSDDEARDNLSLVRGLLVDEVAVEEGLLEAVLDPVRRLVPAGTTAWVALVLWLVVGVALLVAQLSGGNSRRLAVVAAVAAMAVLLVAGPLAWLEIRSAQGRERWVILSPVVEARSGPGEQYTTVFTVHEGLVVRRRGSAAGWERVSLPNGLDGWVRAETVERI